MNPNQLPTASEFLTAKKVIEWNLYQLYIAQQKLPWWRRGFLLNYTICINVLRIAADVYDDIAKKAADLESLRTPTPRPHNPASPAAGRCGH